MQDQVYVYVCEKLSSAIYSTNHCMTTVLFSDLAGIFNKFLLKLCKIKFIFSTSCYVAHHIQGQQFRDGARCK